MSAGNPDQKVYVYAVFFFPELMETGIGGVKSPKIRGGGENFEFPGAPEIDPFLQRF